MLGDSPPLQASHIGLDGEVFRRRTALSREHHVPDLLLLMHSMTIATKGFSPLVLLALPDDGSAPQRLPKTVAVPVIRSDRHERPWVSSSVIDGHSFLGASAHSSKRNVMMPITARAVATSVHEVFTCSLNIALVPPFLHRKTRNRILHSSSYKMLFCEVRCIQGPGVLTRIVWETMSQRGNRPVFSRSLDRSRILESFLGDFNAQDSASDRPS